MANDLIFGSTPEGGVGKVGGQYFIIGRVTTIVLGEYLEDGKTKNPDWTSPADLGKIDFEILYTGLNLRRANKVSKSAWPIFSFIKQYPLINEIVYIVSGPTDGLNDNYKNQKLFYYPPFSLWNSINHNAFPNMEQYSEFLQYYYQQPGYQGSATTAPAKLPLGDTFFENEKVKTLKPFEGDSLIEGRFGQSIRFGSSNFFRRGKDNWSTVFSGNERPGDDELAQSSGKPITIIINGQGNPTVANSDKFSTTIEDISRDDSSIYLTSGQILNTLNVSDIKGEKYAFPYKGNQALITSDRVMLYSKKENVLLYSRQDIGLASIKNTTINSDKTIITSNKILLGDAFATEAAMLGDTFTIQLTRLLEGLNSAANRLQGASSTNPGAAAQSIRLAGLEINDSTTKMLNYLKKRLHLSKIVNIE
jgi:hypothetical protein